MDICNCGMIKQNKAGTRVDDVGVERCNACLEPVSFEAARRAGATTSAAVPPAMMTTLSGVPGHHVVCSHGVVTELAATAGFTATSKGNLALETAIENLGRSAARLKANAIVGLQSSVFGAAGGITSAFGGDAVGVLLTGTAVTVVPHDEPSAVMEAAD